MTWPNLVMAPPEGDVLAGDLVAGHDRGGELDAEAERARALRRAGGQDRDVVGGVEDERSVAESSMGSA